MNGMSSQQPSGPPERGSDLRGADAGPRPAGPRTGAPQPGGKMAPRRSGLRQASLAALITLTVQYALGIGVNLYVTLPAGRGAGQAFSHGPMLAIHAVLGLLLIIIAASVLVRAIIARHRAVIIAAVLGLLAIIAAVGYGASFAGSGTTYASMGMAMATAVAMACYAVSLFAVPAPGSGPS
jgi:hypothetical protein